MTPPPPIDAGDLAEPPSADRLPDFNVISVRRDDEVIVALRGEVDLAAVPLLERELSLGSVREARDVLVDVERVAFMDLSGLRPLLSLVLPSRPGHRVAITAGSAPVQRLLELSGLRRHFNVVAGDCR
ncbi:MAG: STAS domain-containing protein [Solirubrobacteraceae bacterium]